MKTPPRTDAEVLAEWRRVIRMRCEWTTMLRGSWRRATLTEIVSESAFHREPEQFGPPWHGSTLGTAG